MVASAGVWLCCTVMFWWLWGVGFEAADALSPEPWITNLAAPSFALGCVAFVLFWLAVAMAVARGTRMSGSHEDS